VFHELGAEVIAIGNQPNGLNINDKYGATEPASLSAAVKEHAADIGIALDGDADRLLMVDASGRIFNGDELLYVMVKDRHVNGGLDGAVGTLMTNMAVETAFKKMGVGFARAKVGDRYVLEVLQERGWHIGGEGSGHLLFLDKHTTGDGIVSALQVLSALQRSQQTLAESTADMSLWPQTLINVKVQAGFDWQKNTKLMQAKEQADKKLANDGRVLIRASGTEPLIRVMVEARDAELARSLAEDIAAQV
jgi:phosphoglucosamine mutase